MDVEGAATRNKEGMQESAVYNYAVEPKRGAQNHGSSGLAGVGC